MPAAIRKAAAGRAWQQVRQPDNSWRPYLPRDTSRVHLTDGAPFSRTGRNVRALCGATVWPNLVPDDHPAPICAPCRQERARRGL